MVTNLEELDKILPYLSDDEALETFEVLFRDHFQSDPGGTQPYVRKGLELARKNNSREKEVTFTMFLALAYSKTGDYSNAVNLFDEALDKAKNLPDKSKLAEIYNGIGAHYLENEDFSKALEYFYKGLELNIKPISARLYNNIGQAFKEKKHLDKALEFFNKSAQLKKELKQEDGQAFYLMSVGDICREQGEFDKALNYYFQCLDLCFEKNLGTLKNAVQGNIGIVYSLQGLDEKAVSYFERSLEGARQMKDSYLISFNAIALAKYHKENNHLDISTKLAEEALALSGNATLRESKVEALNILMENNEASGNTSASLTYAKQLIETQKGLLNDGKVDKIERLLIEKDDQIRNLETHRQEMEIKNEELRQFAQIVAHDLKEPLRTIGGFTNLLQRRFNNVLDENAIEYMDFIMTGTRQMNHLLTDLLAYVTLDNSEYELEKVDFNEIVQQVKISLYNAIENSQGKIICEPLPIGLAYSPPISQVFQNLMHNGLKFSNGKPIVRVSATEDDDYFRFCIEDNGVGIKEEYKEKIFQIFSQLNNQIEGTGIGLSICRKIVQLHEGKIYVDSKPGRGSKFYFTIRKFER
ncbi:MAG: tetratricopeptide repeat protein [Bacteroidota bacterium]